MQNQIQKSTTLRGVNSFLPDSYIVPDKSKQFLKLSPGENKLRILSSPLLGFVFFNEENKPVRRSFDQGAYTNEELVELNAKKGEDGEIQSSKHFWIMLVWDYNTKSPKILELTQISILKPLFELAQDQDWGDLREFNINIGKTGSSKLDTEYTVVPKPHSALSNEINDVIDELEQKNLLNLNAIWEGNYPFESYNW